MSGDMPRKRPDSRRGDPRTGVRARPLVGPENLMWSEYEVEIRFVCSADGRTMGRFFRLTAPELPDGYDYQIRMEKIPGTNVLPEQDEGGHLKARPGCTKCGRDVPIKAARIEKAFDEIATPWARRVVKVPI